LLGLLWITPTLQDTNGSIQPIAATDDQLIVDGTVVDGTVADSTVVDTTVVDSSSNGSGTSLDNILGGVLGGLGSGRGPRAFALGDHNQLVSFSLSRPRRSQNLDVTGVDGELIGIDFRPANGELYGLTDKNQVYQIDSLTGAATLVSTLNVPFEGGKSSGIDFNPVPDRLRAVGSNEQNFRLNVDTGEVADFDANTPGIQPDRALSYAPTDINAGKDPNIVGEAYTQSFAPSPDATRRVTLYGIDSNLDTLVRQGGANFPDTPPSPNEGQLFTVGQLGVDFSDDTGFDILTLPNGRDLAIAVSDAQLYRINLNTGAARKIGTIGDGDSDFFGLALTGSGSSNSQSGLFGNGIFGNGNSGTTSLSSGSDTLNAQMSLNSIA
jgi:hypothetical protein